MGEVWATICRESTSVGSFHRRQPWTVSVQGMDGEAMVGAFPHPVAIHGDVDGGAGLDGLATSVVAVAPAARSHKNDSSLSKDSC